jgi:flagella basal body P-ring formation protein FlgA
MSAALFAPLFFAAATGFADLPAIDREVARFTGASIGQEGGASLPVDRRLRLSPCASPLALGWQTARRETVVVQCPDIGGWRLFVPARASAQGTAAAPAVNRGDAVTIAVRGPGFSVSQPGEALEPGAPGAWVRVRAAGAGARAANDTMRAQVIRPGLVALPLP